MSILSIFGLLIAFLTVTHYPSKHAAPPEANAGEWRHTAFYEQHGVVDRPLFFVLPDETSGCAATTPEEFHKANRHHGESWKPMRIIDRHDTDYPINIAGNMVMANADWVNQLGKLDAASATHEKMEVFDKTWGRAANIMRRCGVWDAYFWVIMGVVLLVARIASIIEMCRDEKIEDGWVSTGQIA